MPDYTILLTKKARKQLDKLSDNIADPILKAIAGLELEPRPSGAIKLKGREGYRIRIGNYWSCYICTDTKLRPTLNNQNTLTQWQKPEKFTARNSSKKQLN